MDPELLHLADPHYFGPGTWNAIHSICIRTQYKSEFDAASLAVKSILDGIKCWFCYRDAHKYWDENPLIRQKNCDHSSHFGGQNMCAFMWSWVFHNYVNAKVNAWHAKDSGYKPKISPNPLQCYRFYQTVPEKGTCEGGCGAPVEKTEPPTPSIIRPTIIERSH